MKNYLVDFENIQDAGLEKLHITPKNEDCIYILFTENANKISLNTLSSLPGKIGFIPVPAGKESLDRHLLIMLGFLLHKNGKDCSNIILSNDTGYDCILDCWTKAGYHISRLAVSLEKQMPQSTPAEITNLNNRLMNALKKSNLPNDKKGKIASYVIKNKANKHDIYCWIIKTFGQKQGLEAYRLIAALL